MQLNSGMPVTVPLGATFNTTEAAATAAAASTSPTVSSQEASSPARNLLLPPLAHVPSQLPQRIAVSNNTTKYSQVTKPPLLRQRAATTTGSTAATNVLDSTSSTGNNAPSPPPPPPPAAHSSHHIRDWSDLTTDTIVPSPPTLSSATNSPHLTIHHTASDDGGDTLAQDAEMDEDALWTRQMMQTHRLRLSFCMLVTPQTLALKKSTRTQVSILRHVADLYHLSTFDMVSIHRLVTPDAMAAARHAVAADFLLVTIKDQFISRGDMHFFQKSLLGQWIYQGERLSDTVRGVQAHAREIRHGQGHCLVSGLVTAATKITFRSRSSRIIWLVQMSSEMYEYASPYESNIGTSTTTPDAVCELYFDKWIQFVYKLFGKWKELEATHSLTVVFFSRSFRGTASSPTAKATANANDTHAQYDIYGRRYEDHFRVVLENETGPDWESLVVKIKQAFVQYPQEMKWTSHMNLDDADSCWPSTANQGNVLEAINVTLNMLQFHYLDRDLQRTGNSIVVISAGNGVFEVDRSLAGISYQRMVDNGIGS
jgi:hypothetical protein